MYLSYLWTHRMCTLEQAVFETKLNCRTIIRWWIRFHRLCADYFNAHPIQIGGSGTSLEIDETFLTSWKAEHGHCVRRHGRWIFGGTESGSNRSFMVLVELLTCFHRFYAILVLDLLRWVESLSWNCSICCHSSSSLRWPRHALPYTEYREKIGRVQILCSTKGNPQ
jgi:hypothetical protein